MYATHDFSSNNTNFKMVDWWIWSSPDLVDWTVEAAVLPKNTPSPPSAWSVRWWRLLFRLCLFIFVFLCL